MENQSFDVAVIGGGMAGASLAAELSAGASVLLLEREEQPGVHATGRSAAAFIPSYGIDNPALRALTKASFEFFSQPPSLISEHSLLTRRGLLTLLGAGDAEAFHAERVRTEALLGLPIDCFSGSSISELLPAISEDFCTQAWFEPGVYDIDVHTLHQGYLREHRRRGGEQLFAAGFEVSRRGDHWALSGPWGKCRASVVVNAAGAWGDVVAEACGVPPLALSPLRRTAVLLDPPDGYAVDEWPLVLAHDGSFYLKPDAGMVLVSPADEHPSPPCDAQPEELDVAVAVNHAEQVLRGFNPRRVPHKWAGLRTFTPDRTPAIGFDGADDRFFWIVGQGGHGIQIAPAAARLAAAQILGKALPPDLAALEFKETWVAPGRFVSGAVALSARA